MFLRLGDGGNWPSAFLCLALVTEMVAHVKRPTLLCNGDIYRSGVRGKLLEEANVGRVRHFYLEDRQDS